MPGRVVALPARPPFRRVASGGRLPDSLGMTRTRAAATVLLGLAVLIAGAGCGADGGGTATAPPAARDPAGGPADGAAPGGRDPKSIDPCDLLTPADLKEIVGVDLTERTPSQYGIGRVCQFHPPDKVLRSVNVSVVAERSTPERFEEDMRAALARVKAEGIGKDAEVIPVPGLGAAAFYLSLLSELAVLTDDGIRFALNDLTSDQGGKDMPPTLPKLAERVLTRL
jgi:hypothetical protein